MKLIRNTQNIKGRTSYHLIDIEMQYHNIVKLFGEPKIIYDYQEEVQWSIVDKETNTLFYIYTTRMSDYKIGAKTEELAKEFKEEAHRMLQEIKKEE